MTEVAYTAAQAGTNTIGGGTPWDESLGSVFVSDGVLGGIRFTVSDGILPIGATLALVSDLAVTPTDDLRVFFATSQQSAAFSSAAQPTDLTQVIVGTFKLKGIPVADGETVSATLRVGWIARNICQPSGTHNGNLNFILESTSAFQFRDLSDTGDEPTLTIDQNTATNAPGFSVANRQHRQRWFISPRDGFPNPISLAVRDGERRQLYVVDGDQDKPGRRDTRGHGRREREPRMWPRL